MSDLEKKLDVAIGAIKSTPVIRSVADLKRIPIGTQLEASWPGMTIRGNLGDTAVPAKRARRTVVALRSGFLELRVDDGPKQGTISRLEFKGSKIEARPNGFAVLDKKGWGPNPDEYEVGVEYQFVS